MAEHSQSPDDLYPFAEALVSQIGKNHLLRRDAHRKEDAIQDLFLAGWQVWCDTGDVGLAKNRMVSRKNNLLRDAASERQHEPKRESRFPKPKEHNPGILERDGRRAELCGNPAQEALVNDFLGSLTERQRQIVQLRMAAFTNQEIADELGVGLRTVERELSQVREEYEREE